MNYLIVVNDLDKKRILKEISAMPTFTTYKIIGIEEFKKKMFFEYSEKTVFYIVERYNITIDLAKLYLDNLYFIAHLEKKVENEKILFLKELYQELLAQNLLTLNPLWKENLKNHKLVFYHLKIDKYTGYMIEECKRLTEVEQIDLEPKEQVKIKAVEYQTLEQEVIGILNEICQLIKEGIPIANMYLTNLSQDYRQLFAQYGKIFHIPISFQIKECLYSSMIVTDFCKEYYDSEEEAINKLKLKYNETKEQDIINKIIQIINKYAFIKETDRKKRFILHDIKSISLKREDITNSVHEIDFDENEVPKDAILFVVGMNEGIFPKIYKDEKFLNDKENSLLGWNNSFENNELEKEFCMKKLKTIQYLKISYARKNGKVELYPSNLIEKMMIPVEINREEIYEHSHLFNQLELSKKLEIYQKYGNKPSNMMRLLFNYSKIPYQKYENIYRPFSSSKTKLETISYSSIDVFFHCAFRYYLKNILHLDEHEKTFYQKIGSLFHVILKESYYLDFDFETAWNKNNQMINPQNAKEKYFLNKLKIDLKRILSVLNKQESTHKFQVICEKNLSLEIENVKLTGILDKIFMKKKGEKTFISIVDYKTGTPNLNLNNTIYGLNLQLPIYLLLIKSMPIKDIKIIGFYFQKILPTIPLADSIHLEEELKNQQLKLQGYSIDEEEILKEFDINYENSDYIDGLKKSSKGFYAYSKVLNEKQFQKLEALTLEKIKEAIREISINLFPINPKRIGNKLIGCEHCTYQDICFYKEKDIQNLKEQKMSDFLGGSQNANMDQRTEYSHP